MEKQNQGKKNQNEWSKPELEEIPLMSEVSTYSSAELPDNQP